MRLQFVGQIYNSTPSHLLRSSPKVISKIENEKAEGSMVVPIFTTQIWFPRVMRLLIDYLLLLPDSDKSLFFPYRMKKPPVLPITACHVSETLYKGLDF